MFKPVPPIPSVEITRINQVLDAALTSGSIDSALQMFGQGIDPVRVMALKSLNSADLANVGAVQRKLAPGAKVMIDPQPLPPLPPEIMQINQILNAALTSGSMDNALQQRALPSAQLGDSQRSRDYAERIQQLKSLSPADLYNVATVQQKLASLGAKFMIYPRPLLL